MMPHSLEIFNTVFTGIAAIAAVVAAIFAYKIGTKQNQISEFVEIFLMPQQITYKQVNGDKTEIKWSILVKNISSYPIYLNTFTLNTNKSDIGSTAIPNNSDSWYAIPIPDDVQNRAEFSLVVFFEDYLGRKCSAKGSGTFDRMGWNIKSEKRILL